MCLMKRCTPPPVGAGGPSQPKRRWAWACQKQRGSETEGSTDRGALKGCVVAQSGEQQLVRQNERHHATSTTRRLRFVVARHGLLND